MIEIVKRAALSRWAPAVVAGILGLAAAGQAQAASVASIQRNFDEATGQVRPASVAYDGAAVPTHYVPSDEVAGACRHTSLERRYNAC